MTVPCSGGPSTTTEAPSDTLMLIVIEPNSRSIVSVNDAPMLTPASKW